MDGEAHVTVAKLGQNTVVFELDHGVDDALRVDHDFNLGHGDIEEPFGFDHFEAFVEKCSGIDGDFSSHVPGGMFEGLGYGDGGELISRKGAKRAAASGEEEAADRIAVVAFQALEDGVVFAINGKDSDAFGFGGSGNGFASHHEDFFAGDGEIHATFDRSESGCQAGCADDGDEDEVGVDSLDQIDKALGT